MKMYTLLDRRGNISSFIHISNGKLHDVHAFDLLLPEPGATYLMDRGYVDFARLHVPHQAGVFFVTPAKSNLDPHWVHSASTDRACGAMADQIIALDGYNTSWDYPARLRRIRFKDSETGLTLVFLSNRVTLAALMVCALHKSRCQVGCSSSGSSNIFGQAILWYVGECSENADLDRRVGLRVVSGRQAATSAGSVALQIVADPFGHTIRKTADPTCALARNRQIEGCHTSQSIEYVHFLTGQECITPLRDETVPNRLTRIAACTATAPRNTSRVRAGARSGATIMSLGRT